MLILLYFIEFISELVERAKRFVAKIGMTAEEKARAREQIAKLERAKELYTSAYRATMNAVSERANAQNSQNNAEKKVPVGYNESVSNSLKRKPHNEYNTIGMQWAYNASTKIGDRKVLYNPYKKKYVLVEATKDGVGFIELNSGTYKQMREDAKIYESNEQGNFADDERVIDTALHNFEVRQNDNARNNVNVGNRGKGIQNAEVSEGKSGSNGTADSQATDGDLTPKSFSLKRSRFRPKYDWHTGLSKDQIIKVEGWIRKAGRPAEKNIIGTAFWYKGRLDGDDFFAIYSTERSDDPTVLYFEKGKDAINVLYKILEHAEEIKNGKSSVGKSAYVNWVSGGSWMQQPNSIQNSSFSQRGGGSNKNVGVFPRQSQGIASGALRNVIDDLFAKEGEVVPETNKENFSLKGGVNSEIIKAIADVQEGKAGATDRLAKYVDSGMISSEAYKGLIEKYGAIPKGENPHRDIQVPKKTADSGAISFYKLNNIYLKIKAPHTECFLLFSI